jgi:hypothetical protein
MSYPLLLTGLPLPDASPHLLAPIGALAVRSAIGYLMAVIRLHQPPLALSVAILFLLGIGLRMGVFRLAAPIRVHWNLENAWRQGSGAIQSSQHHFFRGVVAAYNDNPVLDYPPLRMYIATAWVRIIRSQGAAPAASGSTAERFDSILWPLLLVNAVADVAAAAGLYFLCRLCGLRRTALLVAAVWWFNPVTLLVSFAWPQWDSWPVGPLLLATACVLAGKRPAAFAAAGALVAVAALLKGQSLLVAAWFPLVTAGRALWLDRSPRRALIHLAALLASAATVVFLVTLPFTLHHSTQWLAIYAREITRDQVLSVDAWNLPLYLQDSLGLAPQSAVGIGPIALALSALLKSLFLAWLLWITLATIRSRDLAVAMLGPGLIFAAAFALLPGMHERYGLWPAALLTPVILRRWPGIVTYSLVSSLALLCPLAFCLVTSPDAAPRLSDLLIRLGPPLGLLWTAAALAATFLFLRPPPAQLPMTADEPRRSPRSDGRQLASHARTGTAVALTLSTGPGDKPR